jgi:hypothetical protein
MNEKYKKVNFYVQPLIINLYLVLLFIIYTNFKNVLVNVKWM